MDKEKICKVIYDMLLLLPRGIQSEKDIEDIADALLPYLSGKKGDANGKV